MKGRDIFKVVYPVLKLLSYLFFILPRFIVSWFWILADLLPSILGVGFRYILALRLSKSIGKNVFFGRGVEIKSWENLDIGSNVSIHKDCYIDAFGGLKIGNDVSIAHNSSILTSEHTWNNKDKPIRSNSIKLNYVEIEDDVWIGCGCRILSGIKIGRRSIVAAGAVVAKDIENGSLVGGGPCKINKKVGRMRALFVHDHMFKSDGQNVYSDKLPYFVWQRYLYHFDSITVFARYSYETTNISKQPLSSGENVFFEFAPNISSFRAMIGRKQEQKKRLEKLILKYDVVIARLPSEYGLMAVELANKLNKKLVVEVVGCAWDSLWNYGNLKAKMYAPILTYRMKKAVKNADFISYVSQEFLQSRYSGSEKAITVSVSNVEIPLLNEDILKKRLEKIELKNEKIVFGLIGSFKTKYKGIHDAIPVLGKLSKKYPNLEFRILGSGNPDEYIEMAKQYNIEDKVFFDGVLPSGEAVFKWIDNIDVYIHPSYQEGVPRALIEAMSRGCPSIASTAGGIPELLDKNLTFNPSDKNKFYEILEKNIFSIEWRIEQARRNFEKSKEYQKDILDKRRFDFFEKVKNS